MTSQPDPADRPDNPLGDFSNCHAGITQRLQALAALPDLADAAARARRLAAESLSFFDEVIRDHHGAEERELFPAVIGSATRGDERDLVQTLVDHLTAEHRHIEAEWAQLAPALKAIARGHDSPLDAAALQRLIASYGAHAGFEEREFLPLSQRILGRNSHHLAALAVSLHMRHTLPETLARWGHRI